MLLHRLISLAIAACLSFGVGSASARADDITVFAASSLYDVLTDAGDTWQANTGNAVTFSFAATSTLARQIDAGAPADVFIAASADWMDTVTGRIIADSRVDVAGNALVVISGDMALLGAGLAAVVPDMNARLAMASVDAVPAGIYGKAALRAAGLWNDAVPFVVQTRNVRAALQLVRTGEARFGVVYLTDALGFDDVALVARFDPGTYPAIRYPAAALTDGHEAAARGFIAFLRSDAGQAIFARHGFAPPPDQAQ